MQGKNERRKGDERASRKAPRASESVQWMQMKRSVRGAYVSGHWGLGGLVVGGGGRMPKMPCDSTPDSYVSGVAAEPARRPKEKRPTQETVPGSAGCAGTTHLLRHSSRHRSPFRSPFRSHCALDLGQPRSRCTRTTLMWGADVSRTLSSDVGNLLIGDSTHNCSPTFFLFS